MGQKAGVRDAQYYHGGASSCRVSLRFTAESSRESRSETGPFLAFKALVLAIVIGVSIVDAVNLGGPSTFKTPRSMQPV